MHSVKIKLAKLILVGTRITYQATGDAGILGVHSCNCEIVVCFRSPFARALFEQKLKVVAEEGRPDTVVEVWAQFVHSGARGRRSKLFLRRSGEDDFQGFLHEALFYFHP